MRPVFVHVNKNGGTSIIHGARDRIVNAGHRTASSWLAEHGHDAPLFAVVRHPYDRAASEYAYRRRRLRDGEHNPHLDAAAEPLDAWVAATFVDGVHRTAEYFARSGVPFNPAHMIDGQLIWFIPQTRWLGDPDGRLLVDDVLRFERLEDDWAMFAARHGIDAPLPHVNASPGSEQLRAELDERSKRILHDHYRADFETFGYEP